MLVLLKDILFLCHTHTHLHWGNRKKRDIQSLPKEFHGKEFFHNLDPFCSGPRILQYKEASIIAVCVYCFCKLILVLNFWCKIFVQLSNGCFPPFLPKDSNEKKVLHCFMLTYIVINMIICRRNNLAHFSVSNLKNISFGLSLLSWLTAFCCEVDNFLMPIAENHQWQTLTCHHYQTFFCTASEFLVCIN